MAESLLVSQLVKQIESVYKEKMLTSHQLAELQHKSKTQDDQIKTFEKTLGYIAPDFDFRTIRKVFNPPNKRYFKMSVQALVAQVFQKKEYWLTLSEITFTAISIDNDVPANQVKASREQKAAVANVLRRLYKKGIIKKKEQGYLGSKTKILEKSLWQLDTFKGR